MKKIRIVIADDHRLFRSGLRELIRAQPDMDVVAEAESWDALDTILAEHSPAVATVDLTMPGGTAVSRLKAIKRRHPSVRIVVVTMHDEPVYVRAAVAAGATGYVTKAAAEDELMEAIREAVEGRLYSSIAVAGPDAPRSLSPTDNDERSDEVDPTSLSPRELEVLESAARGLTNREIAEQLHLSVKTVESYRSRLMLKLNIHTRAELVNYAMKHQLAWSLATPGQKENAFRTSPENRNS